MIPIAGLSGSFHFKNMESITLYFREGSSDKVYQASISPQGEGFMVHFAYGRRGSTLSTGTKTSSPVSHNEAKRIYDKLIQEKTAKGYLPGDDAGQIQHPTSAKKHTGIQCQLLNPITDTQLERLLFHPDYWMQEKMDGRRLLIKKEGGIITGINRLGFPTAVPESILNSVTNYPRDFILDGEAVGDQFHVFDLLSIGHEDLRTMAYSVRFFRLRDMLYAFDHPNIHKVPSQLAPGLMNWFTQLKAGGSEGVVFKNKHAPFTPGRPNAGGPHLKYKFVDTASFIVAKVNDKRSVSLILFDGEKVRPAGNVTIPPNHDTPSPGSVVECRYLYAFRESGSIYQPVYLGVREDIRSDECTTAQLKYKAEAELV
jgi:bifunctional non-homologous end joining protein LigD